MQLFFFLQKTYRVFIQTADYDLFDTTALNYKLVQKLI